MPAYYESLGAPIVIFMHGTENDDIIEKNLPDSVLSSPSISSSLRNPATETVDSIYPPQPWGRIRPFDEDRSRLVRFDAKVFHRKLLQSDRARTRYYLNGLLDSFLIKKPKKTTNKTLLTWRAPLGLKMKRTPEKIISVYNQHYPDFQFYLPSPYVKIKLKQILLPLHPTLFARDLRRDLRYSSPKDGYCAPFPSSLMRSCSNGNESVVLPFPKLMNASLNSQGTQNKDGDCNDPSIFKNDPTGEETSYASDGNGDAASANDSSENSDTGESVVEGTRTISKATNIRRTGKLPFRSKIVPPFPKPRDPCMNPQYYGNCLVALPCPCDRNEIKPNMCHGWYLVHPRGTCIKITRINLPQSKLKSSIHSSSLIADVNEPILQITRCFDGDDPIGKSQEWYSEPVLIWRFATRTPSAIVIVSFEWSGSHSSELCTASFTLKHIKRIEFPKIGDTFFIPTTLAARIDHPQPFVHCPSTLATVSSVGLKSHYDDTITNVIHRMIVADGSDAQIHSHVIKPLHSISLIDFSKIHPMVLWSASRSNKVAPYVEGPYLSKLPTIGYGHSLYSIDLRSNDAALTWSPSRMEYCMERVHSISGMLQDTCNPYHLYVSSISAGGKIWKIDCRMNSHYVCSWALPGLCDDYNPVGSSVGVYGFGTIMTHPVLGTTNACERECLPLLTITKTPGSFGFHLLQESAAVVPPRFATQHLEIPACPDGNRDHQRSGLATSSTFKVAGNSSGIFATGLTAFYTPTATLMDESSISDLGYVPRSPDHFLCVITANSIGDLFGYTLIQNQTHVHKRSIRFDELPIGTSTVPVPESICLRYDLCKSPSDTFHWYLSNRFPSYCDTALKQCSDNKNNCRPFTVIDLSLLNRSLYVRRRKIPLDFISLHHNTFNEMYIGEKVRPPTILKLPAPYCHGESPDFSRYSSITEATNSVDNLGRCDLKNDTISSLRNFWQT